MYSQQSSENPIRTRNCTHLFRNFQLNFPTVTKGVRSLTSQFTKPIKSVLATVLAIVIFVGLIMCAYSIEGSINVGFKPDFQNQNTSYSSDNALFAQYDDMITVKIIIHGTKEFSVRTPIITVGEVIDNLSITLDANDTVNYPDDEIVTSGMEICIDRIETKTYTATVTVPYQTTVIESRTIPKGSRNVITAGTNGSSTEEVTETYVNGELQKRDVTVISTTTEATNEVVEVGVGGTYTDCYGNTYAYSYYIDVTATAYGTGSGVTATGKAVDFGMIAVDPRVIPLGTKVYLTGSWGDMGVHSAEDTGGAIKGNKIDVFLGDDYETLMQFGRRSMRVYILD